MYFFGGHSAVAQQQGALNVKPNQVNWIYGPATASLGEFAEINIPEGYRFAGSEEAPAILRLMNNPAPDALVGIMSPVAGKWMVVFEYMDTGYVKDTAAGQLDAESILNKLRKRLADQNKKAAKEGIASVASVDWQMKPTYDPARQSVEWAIRAEGQASHTINHVVRLHGRLGVLDGIAVLPEEIDFEAVPLKQLMSNVTFRQGYTYADYRKGDTVSKHGMSDLITAKTSPENPGHSMALIAAWGGGGVALLGICIWAVRRRSPEEAHPATNGEANHVNGARKTLAGNVVAPYKPNGHKRSRTQRRKIFDYQKYYSDLLLQVSDGTSELTNRQAPKRAKVPPPVPGAENGSLTAHLSLIDSQMKLIEEQQRLIREQAKLIDEKTRVIQEKTQVLEKQVELFGNNLF